jgi:hypothetical protein
MITQGHGYRRGADFQGCGKFPHGRRWSLRLIHDGDFAFVKYYIQVIPTRLQPAQLMEKVNIARVSLQETGNKTLTGCQNKRSKRNGA